MRDWIRLVVGLVMIAAGAVNLVEDRVPAWLTAGQIVCGVGFLAVGARSLRRTRSPQ